MPETNFRQTDARGLRVLSEIVPDTVADAWHRLRTTDGTRPVNRWGLPLRPYADHVFHGDFIPAGIYVNWQDDATRRFIWQIRQTPVVDQPTHASLAETYGFAHDLQPYRASDAWARRVRATGARGGARRDPRAADHRRYSRNAWSPQALRRVDRPEAAGFRHFGIEVEFMGSGHGNTRQTISDAMIAAGIDTHVRWGEWHRAAGIPGWHCTHDSTVTGEIISDIMDGSPASRDEVAAVLRIVRDNGGRPAAGQGMHVHHDVRDFTTADKLRLVDNIAACQDALLAYVGNRINSGWCRPMSASYFADISRAVAAGGAGSNDHSSAWNFGHLNGRGSIEFRALGNTLNGRKVRAWIQVGQVFMAATKAGEVFAPHTTVGDMLATLRRHGLSRWAADVFATRCGLVPAAA